MKKQRWFQFSYAEQMAHIGGEVTRARIWDEKGDQITCNRCIERAFELIDLTITDLRWKRRLKEICRFREVLADHYAGTSYYNVPLTWLEQYCNEFAMLVRRDF